MACDANRFFASDLRQKPQVQACSGHVGSSKRESNPVTHQAKNDVGASVREGDRRPCTSRTSARAHDLATQHAPLGVGIPADQTHGRTGLTTVEREELARLRQEKPRPPGGARHLKKPRAFLHELPAMRFAFIAAEESRARGHDSLSVLRCYSGNEVVHRGNTRVHADRREARLSERANPTPV
jgi:hypothetical protein